MFRRVVLIGALSGVLGCFLLDQTVRSFRTQPDNEKHDPPGAHPFGTKDSRAERAVSGPARTRGNSPERSAQTVDRHPPADRVNPVPLSRRLWDESLLVRLRNASVGDTIQFDLSDGDAATGMIRHVERKAGELVYLSGDLESPEPGRFFFQKQTLPGKAGKFAGVVEFPHSQRAYRVEPATDPVKSELVELPLAKVICLAFPAPDDGPVVPEEIPPLNPSDFMGYPIPDYQEGIVALQSRPGATGVLFIDYRGGYTPTWGGITYARPNVSNADIRNVWKRVAEDFMPFDVNVTTDAKVFEQAPENCRQRCIVTTTTTAAPGAGGVAYLNSWNWTGDIPCWAFYVSGKTAAEVIAHEFGHTLSLSHDGQTGVTSYYAGQGSGETSWAPIMGLGYYKNVTQWSKGEYAGASNSEDDLARMAANNNDFDFRSDDTGPTLATARYLETYPGGSAMAEGVIETPGDTDAFQFTTSGGTISLRANPVGDWADLAIEATLCNAAGAVVASNNPQTTLWAAITTNIPPGTYTFQVTGAGRNDPLSKGFSNYGSLGYYSITGTVANARLPDRLTIAENSPSGTLVGTIQALTNSLHPLAFAIVSGNYDNAFYLDAAGKLRVANPAAIDYEALSGGTQLPVQFELLANIVDIANPALSEYNRRVVVAVTDVNEAPVVSDLNLSVLEHTLPGTVVGQVLASDPDAFSQLAYSIVGGDTKGIFTVGSQDGVLGISGDLNCATQSSYELKVQVSDQVNPTPLIAIANVTVSILTNATPYVPGSVACACYQNISGNLVSALTNSSVFPTDPDSERLLLDFETPSDRADNFGSVVRGFLIPPASGNYMFWIASDDNSELYLSPSTNPASRKRIAYIGGNGSYAAPREWNKFPSQCSVPQPLVAGQGYYIEARHKEGVGADNLAVAWNGPTLPGTNVISGLYLAPFRMNYQPRVAGFNAQARENAFAGARVGRVTRTDVDNNEPSTYTILSGNDDGLFSIDLYGWVQVVDPAALQASPNPTRTLTVRVRDSGFQALSATTSVSIMLLPTNAIAPTAVQREMFYHIGSGTTVADLLASPKFPAQPDELQPLSASATRTNVAENYGSRIRGHLVPPVTGDYQFFIASDDAGQLMLSPDDGPANAEVIASVRYWTSPWEWNKEVNQASSIRSLVAGQKYYIEAMEKEGTGTDHLEVAWIGPGMTGTNVIDAGCLEPIDLNYPPDIRDQSMGVFAEAHDGTCLGTIKAADSPLDSLTFRILDGNTDEAFAVDPVSGQLRVADKTMLGGLATNWSLTVAVQDSGYNGLYPLATAQATVNISILPTNSTFLWTGADPVPVWSRPGNWRGAVPPADARLLFGCATAQICTNDTLASIDSVEFTNGGFSLTGTPLLLKSGVANAGTNTWSIPTTLTAAQTWLNASGLFTLNAPINNSGYDLTFNAGSDVRLTGPVSGNGALVKTGSGALLLSGIQTYAGPTVVAEGTLALATSARLAASPVISIAPAGMLDVTAIQGLWTVALPQTLRGNIPNAVIDEVQSAVPPPQTIGPISIKGNAGFAGTIIIQIRKNGLVCTNDVLTCSGLLQPGGRLIITNIGSETLAAGDTFRVLRAGSFSTGRFASLVLPPLPPGLGWNTLLLTKDGSISVAAEPLKAPALFFAVRGDALTVYWPTDYFSYVLSAQTNSLPAGLGSNWHLLPLQWTNAFTLPIDQSNGSVFLRLSRPAP